MCLAVCVTSATDSRFCISCWGARVLTSWDRRLLNGQYVLVGPSRYDIYTNIMTQDSKYTVHAAMINVEILQRYRTDAIPAAFSFWRTYARKRVFVR